MDVQKVRIYLHLTDNNKIVTKAGKKFFSLVLLPWLKMLLIYNYYRYKILNYIGFTKRRVKAY